jgi:hypothetical protein
VGKITVGSKFMGFRDWRFKASIVLALATAVLVLSAPTAGATVTLGSSMSYPGNNVGIDCGSPTDECTYLSTRFQGDPRRSVRSPVTGTVVRWSVAVATAPASVRLRVLVAGPSPGGYTAQSSSSMQLASTPGTNHFTAAVPIPYGGRIGVDDPDAAVLVQTGVTRTEYVSLATPPDGVESFPFGSETAELLLSAEIEPANTFTVTRKRVPGRGRATLFVRFPNPGAMSIASSATRPPVGKATSARKPLVRPFATGVSGFGEQVVRLEATRSTKRRLKNERKVRGRVVLTYTPRYGTSSTQTVGLKLKLKR